MRVLFVSKNIPVPGRAGNPIILELAQKLRDNYNLEIDILFPKEWVPWGVHFLEKYRHLWKLKPWINRNSTIFPLSYFRLPVNGQAFGLLDISKVSLPKELRNKSYDLIHAHYLLPDAFISHKLSEKSKAPVVSSIRASDQNLLQKVNHQCSTWRLANKALKNSNKILVFNEPMKKFIHSSFGYETHLIPHGIDSSLLMMEQKQEQRDIDVVVVASALKLKRIDWVIKAFKDKASPKMNLLIIGGGPELESLEKLAEGNKNIRFTGKISRSMVLKYLSRCKIFALPSKRETFGMVYLEAAAKRNAIIATDNTGVKGVFKSGEEAIFINTYEQFSDALGKILFDPDKQMFLSKNAYSRATRMTWEKITKEYFSIYSSLVGKGKN